MALTEIAPTTTMEEILRAYPSAKVGLFQRYHIGGCESCSYKPTETLEQVRSLPNSRLVTVELTFEILDTWPKDTLLVFYSNDGRRSLDKASYFRAYGFPRARRLTGALAAWDAEVGREAIPARVEELRE